MRAATILLLPAALAASTGADRDPLAGRVAGKPESCINLNQNTALQIVDRYTILYTESGRRVWRTGPVGPCTTLRPFDTLIVDVWGAQLCRNDRFRVLQQGTSIPSAFCRFDRFTPYDKPKARSG